jgi:hypothetical protein
MQNLLKIFTFIFLILYFQTSLAFETLVWNYKIIQKDYQACFKVIDMKKNKILQGFCDLSYFNDSYTDDERLLYMVHWDYKTSDYKSVSVAALYNDDETNYLKYDNHILYQVYVQWYSDEHKNIIWTN